LLQKGKPFRDVFDLICPVLQTRIGGKMFLSKTSPRAKSLRKLNCFGEIHSVGDAVKISFWDFFTGRKQTSVLLPTVLHEATFKQFLAGNCKGSHFEYFAEKVVRGNAMQIFPDFPAKSLSIYRAHFFLAPF